MASSVSEDPRYGVKTMLAAGLGIALFCGGFVLAGAAGINDWNVFSNCLATPLFATPLAVALYRSGRIGVVGAVVLVFGITVGHVLATCAMIAGWDEAAKKLCMFGDVQACEAENVRAMASKASAPNAAAMASAVGAAFSFAFIATIAPGLRDRRRLGVYALATLVLAAIGWAGWSGTLPRGHDMLVNLAWVARLYLPWQLAFSFALVTAFKEHRAER